MSEWVMDPFWDLASCYPTEGPLPFPGKTSWSCREVSLPSAHRPALLLLDEGLAWGKVPPALARGTLPPLACLLSQRLHVCSRVCRVVFSHLCRSCCLTGSPETLPSTGSCCRKPREGKGLGERRTSSGPRLCAPGPHGKLVSPAVHTDPVQQREE